jgi:hypothetical protein
MMEETCHAVEPHICRRCGTALTPGGTATFYVVKIDAFADPTGPRITSEELASGGRGDIEKLLKELEQYSERELMDMVHRRMLFYLCGGCYASWIENPTG